MCLKLIKDFVAILQEQALIAFLLPNMPPNSNKTCKTGNQNQMSPCGHFALVPSSNGTLLVKALAVQELMLPYNAGNQSENVSQECLEKVADLLNQVCCSSLEESLVPDRA